MKVNLKELFSLAEQSPRKRYMWSPKKDSYSGTRYMINALLPGTYIPPHKHNKKGANEILYVLKGVIIPIFFSDQGEITHAYNLSSKDEFPLIEIPEKKFHTFLVKKRPSAMLEISKGPYNPQNYREPALWAPSENSSEVEKYLSYLEKKVKENYGFL